MSESLVTFKGDLGIKGCLVDTNVTCRSVERSPFAFWGYPDRVIDPRQLRSHQGWVSARQLTGHIKLVMTSLPYLGKVGWVGSNPQDLATRTLKDMDGQSASSLVELGGRT